MNAAAAQTWCETLDLASKLGFEVCAGPRVFRLTRTHKAYAEDNCIATYDTAEEVLAFLRGWWYARHFLPMELRHEGAGA